MTKKLCTHQLRSKHWEVRSVRLAPIEAPSSLDRAFQALQESREDADGERPLGSPGTARMEGIWARASRSGLVINSLWEKEGDE
jgi:hypothetical protein